MVQYKKLSEYEINAAPNDEDLIPTIVSNGDGTYDTTVMPYSALKGTPGTDGTNGVGVPAGGTTGQVLQKVSGASFDTAWVSMTLNKAAVGLGNVDNTSDVDKPVSTAVQAAITAAIAQAKQESYPLGSLYFNADDATNPATLLGFGTWVAHAAGQVPVGKASSGTFSTAGEVIGAETHSHGNGSYGANMQIFWQPNTMYIDFEGTSTPSHVENTRVSVNGAGAHNGFSENGTSAVKVGGTSSTSSSIQPSVVVYIWRRTA